MHLLYGMDWFKILKELRGQVVHDVALEHVKQV